MSPIMAFLVSWIEARYPGAKVYIDFALKYVDPAKLQDALLTVLHDLQTGMSFMDALKDALSKLLPAGVSLPA